MATAHSSDRNRDHTDTVPYDPEGASVSSAVPEKEAKSPGVLRIEAIVGTFTRVDYILLYIGLILGAYGRGLAGMMIPPFQATAVSTWNAAGQTATLGVVRASMASASQPIWAKMMDYLGRNFVLAAGTLFYCLGYIVMATSNNFGQLAGGLVLQIFGFGAQNLLMYVLIADTTSLRSRLLFSMMPSLHMIINTWAAGVIAEKLLKTAGWRWGYGFGAISWPVMAIPLFFVLAWTARRADRRGLTRGIPTATQLVRSRTFYRDVFWKADLPGLFFLTASIALSLIPLTLAGGNSNKWKSADTLAPLLTGLCVALPLFVLWEARGARHPIVPFKLLNNRHVLVSLALGLLVTITGSTQSTYLYFTLVVPFGKSVEVATRVSKLTSFVSTLAGLALGVAVRYVRRVKVFAVTGGVLFVVAYGLLYRYRGGHSASEFSGLIGGEIVLGVATAFAQNSVQTGLQAVVKHENVAVISSLYFCSFQVGAGIGSAITGAIWTNKMPATLRAKLSAAGVADAAAQAASVYGNPLKWITTNAPGTAARTAVDESYRHVQRLLCASGLAFSVLLIVFALFLDNPVLTNQRSIDQDDGWEGPGRGESGAGPTPGEKELRRADSDRKE